MSADPAVPSEPAVKQCCARLYESDFARLLLGDSFHPGGVKLTEHLGGLLELRPESRVLDVASGPGTSAIFLAERFGCEVIGVDYSAANVARANAQAAERGLTRVRFLEGDAERLPVEDISFGAASFDAVVCECAFCTVPDKPAAAREFARALRAGGRVGLSDLTRSGPLPAELETLLAWIACIANAQPLDAYAAWLTDSGLRIDRTERRDEALAEMVNRAGMRLLGAETMMGLGRLQLPGVDLTEAKSLARAARAAVTQGRLGYGLVIATKVS
ncbi:MAG: methyltransferase domain-containing protein [Acidobacteriota bacterium]|nr:methyltransferase domain-containing protein [Acidobacteriota bacterium]